MALQMLYSSWWENETENTLLATSEGIAETDINYIVHTTESIVNFNTLHDDEENVDPASTLYLCLPSGKAAILRSGFYVVHDSNQRDNTIIHAYIATEDEKLFPLLYAINNCFKSELSPQEQQHYLSHPVLPQTPFPRPQFKMSQAEIKKYFSQGRLKTLACLLQAVIDSYQSERYIILNDKFSNLKYWFYGMHCCLPECITQKLTYSTYSYSKSEGCKLICGAPINTINSDAEIEAGQFVLDNVGGATCEDIESAQYARYIVHEFFNDAVAMQSIPEGINQIMTQYDLPVATAIGLMKLWKYDFAWFDSPYDIQYFIGKTVLYNSKLLDSIAQCLWVTLRDPAFKFKSDESMQPLIASIFKFGNADVKKEIIEYIDTHRKRLGVYNAMSLKAYYASITEKLGFLYEYLIPALIRHNKLDEYCQYCENDSTDLSILLYTVVDNFDQYISNHGQSTIEKFCKEIFTTLLKKDTDTFTGELILEFCHKLVDHYQNNDLPEDFIRSVVVGSIWTNIENKSDEECHLEEEMYFAIIEQIIAIPACAADILKVFAREGKYRETTLSLYLALCRNYPDETAAIDQNLLQNDVFHAFRLDMELERFIALEGSSREDLVHFFKNYYLTGMDRNYIFERKLENYFDELLPVRRIEEADHLLHELEEFLTIRNTRTNDIIEFLADQILQQTENDIYDFYSNNASAYSAIHSLFRFLSIDKTDPFLIASLCIDLRDVSSAQNCDKLDELFTQVQNDLPRIIDRSDVCHDFISKFVTVLLKAMVRYAEEHDSFLDTYIKILIPLSQKELLTQSRLASLYDIDQNADEKVGANQLSVLLPFLIDRQNDDLNAFAKRTLLDIPFANRKDIYRRLLLFCEIGENREVLKSVLTGLYYSDLSLLQKIIAPFPDKLFES